MVGQGGMEGGKNSENAGERRREIIVAIPKKK